MSDLFSKFDPLIEQRETLLKSGITDPFNALGAHAVYGGPDGNALLSPYAAWWVVDASSRPVAPGPGLT